METNPERVNDRDDKLGATPLSVAIFLNLTLVVWLLDEKGADVNATMVNKENPLRNAKSLDILEALLNRGAEEG